MLNVGEWLQRAVLECVTEDSDKTDVFDTVRSDLQEVDIVLVTLSNTGRA